MENNQTIKKEGRHERFKRLASKRTQVILKKLEVLGHCANKSTYKYTDQDIRKIFSTIESQLKTIKARFKVTKKDFKL